MKKIDVDNRTVLTPIKYDEKESFLEIAERYFRELNPNFVPLPDWNLNFFESFKENKNRFAYWIEFENERVGFILFGVEEHIYMFKKIGVIYEFYILPDYRKMGLGRKVVGTVIDKLKEIGVSKIQIDVVSGNTKAVQFWTKLNFSRVSERFVLEVFPFK